MLNMVTLRNLIRLAGMALSYKSMHVYGSVVLVYEFIITGLRIVEVTNTALSWRDMRRRNLNSTDIKIEIIRTARSNLPGGRRSIHITFARLRKGVQANAWTLISCRSFTNIPTKNLNVGVMATNLINSVRACKNKDSRFGKLI